MSDAIRVNGNMYSWGSIVLTIDGDKYYGFTSLSFSQKRERKAVYGMGKAQAPRGMTRGKYTVENTKLSGPLSSVQAVRAALAAKSSNGKSYGDTEFHVTCQFVETDETPVTIEAFRCHWVSDSLDASEGSDEIAQDFEIQPMWIETNGLTLFDSSEV